MKKATKIITIILALLLCVSMMSCGNKDKDNTPENNQPNNNTNNDSTHTHSFGEWVTVNDVSCTADGLMERYCKCGEIEPKPIFTSGHDEVHHDAKEATKTEKGWKAYVTCSKCDYTTYEEIPPLGDEGNMDVGDAPGGDYNSPQFPDPVV